MSGSYHGHGAKYWAEKYYDLLGPQRSNNLDLFEDWHAKYIQLEKCVSLYQSQIADLRTEVEDLRTEAADLNNQTDYLRSISSSRGLVQGQDAEYWYSAFCDLNNQFSQMKRDYAELKKQSENQLKEKALASSTYKGQTAEHWHSEYSSISSCFSQLNRSHDELQKQYQTLEHQFQEESFASSVYEGHDAKYWYQEYDRLNRASSNQAPAHFRTLVACSWIIPALLLVYLLQNWPGVLLLHTSFILLFFCGVLSESADEFPGGRFVLQIALVPYIVSFFIYLSSFHLNDFFSVAFAYICFTASSAVFYFIPLFLLQLICRGLVLIADFLFRFFSQKGYFFRFVSACTAIIIISALIFSFPLFRITISPFPESSFEFQSEVEAVEYVWIPTNGGKRYHCSKSCSGMIDPKKVSVEKALDLGFSRCGNCYR